MAACYWPDVKGTGIDVDLELSNDEAAPLTAAAASSPRPCAMWTPILKRDTLRHVAPEQPRAKLQC